LAREKLKIAHVEQALRASKGIVILAAAKLAKAYGSCSAQTVRNYIARHPSIKQALDEVTEENLDLAEGALLKGITDGNMTAVIYYLKTKGKHRGYVERFEQTGADGKPLPSAAVSQVVLYLPDNGRDPDFANPVHVDFEAEDAAVINGKANGHDSTSDGDGGTEGA